MVRFDTRSGRASRIALIDLLTERDQDNPITRLQGTFSRLTFKPKHVV